MDNAIANWSVVINQFPILLDARVLMSGLKHNLLTQTA